MQVSFKNCLSSPHKNIVAFKANPRGFASFTVKNQAAWQEFQDCFMKDKNGKKVLKFAASLAHKIEGALNQNVPFEEAFQGARRVTLERNKMPLSAQNFAKTILAKVWQFGKEIEKIDLVK